MYRLTALILCAALLFTGCGVGTDAVSTPAVPTHAATIVPSVVAASSDANEPTASPQDAETLLMSKETDHFVIHYLQKDAGCLKDLSDGLEAAYRKVTTDLDCPLDYKTDVTVCPDLEWLHQGIGYVDGTGQDAYISAGTIGKHIWLVSPLNPGPVRDYDHMVKSSPMHEFTHVVINDIAKSDTWPERVPRWLNEGVACYEGGAPMPENIMRQQVSSRVRAGKIPTFKELSSYGQDFFTTGGYFFTEPAGTFFVEKYGFEKVKRLILSPGSYEEIFGKTENDVWNEWVDYLKANFG